MKRAVGIIIALIAMIFVIYGMAISISPSSNSTSSTQSVRENENGFVYNGGPYRQKASSSISHASDVVGNFPTDQDRADYALGLDHIGHLHQRIGNYTIYQVISEGKALRLQADAAKEAERQRSAQAARRAAEATAAAERTEAAHLTHGSPDCLVLDDRPLGNESGEYNGYAKGTVRNTCDRNFSYVQVEINYYSPSGALEESGLANVNNLGPGESWSWKTIGQGTAGGSWSVKGITGY